MPAKERSRAIWAQRIVVRKTEWIAHASEIIRQRAGIVEAI